VVSTARTAICGFSVAMPVLASPSPTPRGDSVSRFFHDKARKHGDGLSIARTLSRLTAADISAENPRDAAVGVSYQTATWRAAGK